MPKMLNKMFIYLLFFIAGSGSGTTSSGFVSRKNSGSARNRIRMYTRWNCSSTTNTFIMVSTAETRNCCHSVSLLAAKILKYSYNMSSFLLFEFSATFPPATFSRGTIQEIWPPFLLSSSAVVSSSSS